MRCLQTPVNKATNEAYVISRDNFSLYFSGPVSEFALASQTMRSTLGKTNLTVSDATVTGDQLTCNLHIPVADGYTILPISGKLRSSFRAQNGMNSIIVEVDHKVNGYTVRLFEIVNDTKEDTFLLYQSVDATKSVSGQPHLRVYLEDNNGMLFLLESVLPTSLQGLKATEYEKADKYKDAIFWANDLVEHVLDKVPVTMELLEELGIPLETRALGSESTWIPEDSYRHMFTVGTTENICYSLPYLKSTHQNVTNASDTTWITSFEVAEHTKVSNKRYYGMNTFSYTNLELTFGCGAYSSFIRVYQEGRIYDRTGFGSTVLDDGADLTVDLLTHVVPEIQHAVTFLDVIQFISSMQSESKETYLGSQGTMLLSGYTAAVGEKLPYLQFHECTDQDNESDVGHYFRMHAVLQGYNASATTATTGALSIKFDVLNAHDRCVKYKV